MTHPISRPADSYSPLYFLAALGAGGLAVTFFMWLFFWVPHPGQPVPVFEDIMAAFQTGSLAMQSAILLAMAGIAVFAVLHFKSMIWNVGQYRAMRGTEAWATLKPGPRALYIELKRRYNGANNGEIFLSHRDAAKALSVNRNTVGGYFRELEARGFIWMTQGPHLGPSGIGQASMWALAEVPTKDMKPARCTFMWWSKNQKPRPENRTERPKKPDGDMAPAPVGSTAVLKIVT